MLQPTWSVAASPKEGCIFSDHRVDTRCDAKDAMLTGVDGEILSLDGRMEGGRVTFRCEITPCYGLAALASPRGRLGCPDREVLAPHNPQFSGRDRDREFPSVALDEVLDDTDEARDHYRFLLSFIRAQGPHIAVACSLAHTLANKTFPWLYPPTDHRVPASLAPKKAKRVETNPIPKPEIAPMTRTRSHPPVRARRPYKGGLRLSNSTL